VGLISYDLGISRTASREPHRIRDVTLGALTATDTCIGFHVTRFNASRIVSLHTRYVIACVVASDGRGREKKVNVYLSSLRMKVPDHVYVLG
jgi:hypothetical protein